MSRRIRSFQGRIFLAILLVVLVPASAAVAVGVLTLQGIGSRSGTLGAWDAVAESGRDLLESLDEAGLDDPAVSEAARVHQEALSESVRLSRLYAFVAERFLTLLPLAALATGVVVMVLALVTARSLSRGFGRPIAELAGWTERISRGEPLPEPGPEEARDLREIRTLRTSLRDMAAEIEEGRRRAVEAARLRSWTDLARRVAHELKNPLTPMRMAAATLARDAQGPRAEAGRILTEEIDRLDGMARTFAQYGRLPEGPRSEVDLLELLRSLATQHRTDRVPVSVEGDGVVVHGHYDALERAFRNLLVNAVEAQEEADADRGGAPRDADTARLHGTPGHATAPVRVSVSAHDGWAEVRVRDHGPGIPPDVADTLWNPDVTTKRRGTGLGLAIVRQTVLHHDGTVLADTPTDGGAAFTVRLPLDSTGDS